jgi:hypothetical protein
MPLSKRLQEMAAKEPEARIATALERIATAFEAWVEIETLRVTPVPLGEVRGPPTRARRDDGG